MSPISSKGFHLINSKALYAQSQVWLKRPNYKIGRKRAKSVSNRSRLPTVHPNLIDWRQFQYGDILGALKRHWILRIEPNFTLQALGPEGIDDCLFVLLARYAEWLEMPNTVPSLGWCSDLCWSLGPNHWHM